MTRQFCHIGSSTIAYLDSAPGDTTLRTYVLLHAFPLGANQWEPQMRSIPAGWRLITPDLRGFGGSTELDSLSALAVTDFADDVVDLLKELSIERAVIGGLSMGGYAALALLQGAPQVIEALVLADTRATADSPEGRANRRNMLALVDREGPSGVAREMMPKLLGKTTHESNSGIEAQVAPAHQAAVAGGHSRRHPPHDASSGFHRAVTARDGPDPRHRRRRRRTDATRGFAAHCRGGAWRDPGHDPRCGTPVEPRAARCIQRRVDRVSR